MKRKLLYFLKMYFGFSRRESKGFLLVFPALILLYFFPVIYNRILKSTNGEDYNQYLAQVDLLIASGMELTSSNENSSPYPGKEKPIEQDSLQKNNNYKTPKPPGINLMNFSEADSIVLQVVPGIGEVLSGRIIKFRESLGGLHQRQQLLEVYGITEEVAKKVFEYFAFTPAIHRKLQVNELEANKLAEHPYITYGHAKVIVAYRKQHGKYKNAEDLLKIKIFNEAWLERIRPYLAFDEPGNQQ